MASPSSPLNYLPQPPFPFPSSSFSHHLYLIPLSLNSFRIQRLKISCSARTVEIGTQQNIPGPKKKKRKPRPSFLDQVQEKWSRKTTLFVDKLPWEEQKAEESEGEAEELIDAIEELEEENEPHSNLIVSESVRSGKSSAVVIAGNAILPPWVRGNKQRKGTQIDYEDRSSIKTIQDTETGNAFTTVTQDAKVLELEEKIDVDKEIGGYGSKDDDTAIGLSEKDKVLFNGDDEGDEIDESNEVEIFRHLLDEKDSMDASSSVPLPWVSESDKNSDEVRKLINRNTEMAEKMIPEPELKRLRNVSLRMVERIKVGAAGITQSLVDSIHEKWKVDEVVKLKFEGPPAMNMKRTHETLESRTGGLVIWRSGSSVVLYRGMAYKLDCVKSYTIQAQENAEELESSVALSNNVTRNFRINNGPGLGETSGNESSKYLNQLSGKELRNLTELSQLLDELGPRFRDWSGPEPLPVDADLLPAVVRGYKPPFRVLPFGVRQNLRDNEMTFLRRTARGLPPHFALGRNRELEGLAAAMVKLWEKSAIAKIAIKRGVLNTRNDRMAEELKVLTGGTLVSRNKEYIVFYRGNDFLTTNVTQALMETEKRSGSQHDEEEKAREKALVLLNSNIKTAKGPLVAGTLSETQAATSRWANRPSNEELEKMMREAAVARHASLVKFLENKLAIAKGKITKAERALLKVQENLKPNELPTDLETITDEERFLFRKVGLSMKPYLELGRRGIFDGVIENMHLHWRFRELVKIIVERKSFPLVKHIAISLEAESGGVLVSVDKTTKGYAIIVYRGKNYDRPSICRPKNLLTRRQALARAIELQRREALKRHVSELQGKIADLKSELEHMKTIKEIDEETLSSRVDYASDDDQDLQEVRGIKFSDIP
ncbi:OLC1v1037727C1 [Oldenlandia corymbosa var. corymbosa]|uniref:OLC1v1037727C1 n=1 Tax=Oldenlandia corymbosa var. corymbosa TaxID=529605 RepID=A0AAV1CZA2_OLDCO|nr:OLC1v1037727C1 [Oldenlandia corymbosa var. corymbosa]